MYPKIRGKNFVTKYVLKELSFVILNKAAYNDDETWANVVKVVCVCLSVGLASRTAKLIHNRVVDFPVPRTLAWSVPRLCPLIELGVYFSPSMMMWSLSFPPSEIHPGSFLLQ